MNTSMSSRRPNFNASTFGSPNFVDKTISTKRIINSPFYNGKTIYGGASAYGRGLGRTSQDLKTSLRNSVQIKPVNKSTENGNIVLGKTARRILDTIEQYSSPISDAKKIPIVSRKLRQDGLLTKYTGANPYILRETKAPSNRELQVPTVSELLKMKTRLQESTETVRQLAASSKCDLNTEYYKISTTEDEKQKHTGKIKTKVTSVRPKCPSNESVSEINLTPVSLPITTLPKFDFVIPPPNPTASISGSAAQTRKGTQQTRTSKSPIAQPYPKITQTESNVQIEKRSTTSTVVEYKFSDPLVVAENMKSIVAINNFKFSEPPTCTKNRSDPSKNVTLNFKMPENKLPNLVPNKKTCEAPVKTPKTLKSGSVMDILGKKDGTQKDSLLEKFKPVQGTWECPVCMIRNQPDKTRCAACETPKATPAKPTENRNNFGSQFKLSSDKWACGLCMVHNSNADTKCVSCTTPKPNMTSENKSVPITSSGFGDKFKQSGDTWECSTCMIRNKRELTKCAACETPNPKASSTGTQLPSFGNKTEPSKSTTGQQSGFGNVFKVKTDEWECSICMVRNKQSNKKCQCCEAPNPKCTSSATDILGLTQDKKPISSFNFGIDKAAATNFSFGIPLTAAVSQPKTATTTPSIFGGNAKAAPNTPVNFSFGIPPPTQEKPKTTEPSSTPEPPAELPKSTASKLPSSNPLLKPDEKLPTPKGESVQPSEFKFGISSSTTAVANKEIVKSDAPKVSTEASDSNKPVFNIKPTTTNGEINTVFNSKPDIGKSTPAVTNVGVFAFGTKPAAVAAPLVSTTQPSQAEPAKPIFKFGSTAENPPFNAPNPAATSLNNGFGSTNTPTFGMSNTPSFEKLAPNSTEVKPFTFGGSAQKETTEPASKVPMFSFGQSAATTTTAAKPAGFNFGPTTTPSFNFTAGKPENPTFNPTPGSNMFGSSNAGAQNGTFNFGNMASSNNSQKAGFSFGAAINNSVASSSQSGFNFGASAPGVSS